MIYQTDVEKHIREEFSCLAKSSEKLVIALPGGSSVKLFLDAIRPLKDIAWHNIHFFMVDERCVDLDSEESNFKLLYEYFFSDLLKKELITAKNLHPFQIEFGVGYYNQELERLGGKFDLVVLSSGEDGHVASLFPHHDGLKNSGMGFIQVEGSPKPPPSRISASVELIKSSKNGFLLFIGSNKKVAYKKYSDITQNITTCPAKIIDSIAAKKVFIQN